MADYRVRADTGLTYTAPARTVSLWAVAQIVTARAPKQCYQLLYVYPRDGVRGYLHVAPFVSRLHIHTSSLSANPISAQRTETLESVMGAALSLHGSGSSESGSTPIQSSDMLGVLRTVVEAQAAFGVGVLKQETEKFVTTL